MFPFDNNENTYLYLYRNKKRNIMCAATNDIQQFITSGPLSKLYCNAMFWKIYDKWLDAQKHNRRPSNIFLHYNLNQKQTQKCEELQDHISLQHRKESRKVSIKMSEIRFRRHQTIGQGIELKILRQKSKLFMLEFIFYSKMQKQQEMDLVSTKMLVKIKERNWLYDKSFGMVDNTINT